MLMESVVICPESMLPPRNTIVRFGLFPLRPEPYAMDSTSNLLKTLYHGVKSCGKEDTTPPEVSKDMPVGLLGLSKWDGKHTGYGSRVYPFGSSRSGEQAQLT